MFTLNSNDSVPLYKQLYIQIREHVLSETAGEFQAPVRQGSGSGTVNQPQHG